MTGRMSHTWLGYLDEQSTYRGLHRDGYWVYTSWPGGNESIYRVTVRMGPLTPIPLHEVGYHYFWDQVDRGARELGLHED